MPKPLPFNFGDKVKGKPSVFHFSKITPQDTVQRIYFEEKSNIARIDLKFNGPGWLADNWELIIPRTIIELESDCGLHVLE